MRRSFPFLSLAIFSVFAYSTSVIADSASLSVEQISNAVAAASPDVPVLIEADRIDGKNENQIEATGNVRLQKLDQSIRADRLLFDQKSQRFDASGSVILEQNGNAVSGPQLSLDLATETGTMQQPEFYLKESGGRGKAEVMHIKDRQHYSLKNASYTTCRADDEDWMLKIRGLDIDRERQVGIAHHTWVEFMGVPILYSPWMDFPLSDQQKSGFLSPLFGSTSKGGSELTLPYYWAIAPNRDATIAPRIIAKRGLMLSNELRYLENNYQGEIHVDVLPDDRLAKRSRGRFSLTHQQRLSYGLNGYVDFSRVSEDAFFRDFGASAGVTSQVNLLQEGGIRYNGDWWNATMRMQQYQTLQDPAAPLVSPHARLPQLTVNAQKLHRSGASLDFAGEYVDFSHPTLLNASRLVLNPSVSYPLISESAMYVTPKIALHNTLYAMGKNNVAALPNASRTLPIFSVDSGATFERDVTLFGQDYVNTLEPRLFYVYVPFRNQAALPNFDAAQADFSFTQMFTENRFFGNDRIGDANQVTLAVSSSFLDRDTGAERLRVMIGERFSFEAPRVNLVAPAVSTRSDILVAVAGRVTDAWWLDGEVQLDPNQSHTQRYNVSTSFRPEVGKVLNLGYRFRRNTLRQIDASAQWPLSNNWHAVGRWNYSLKDGRILEAIAGLEYSQACWKVRLVAQRLTTATQQTNTGIFVQLELTDLVRVGSDPLGLLKRSISGYSVNQ